MDFIFGVITIISLDRFGRELIVLYRLNVFDNFIQPEAGEHLNRLLVFLAQLFDQGTGGMAVTINRAKNDISALEAAFKVPDAVFHVAVMVLENTSLAFNQLPVKGRHSFDPADNEDTFFAQIERWTAGIAAVGFDNLAEDLRRLAGNAPVDLLLLRDFR